MTGCFTPILLLVVGVVVIMSLIRWFEQTGDAVDRRQWDRMTLLIVFPFAVWFFPSKVGANRPTAVPRHEPVRGMGTAPKQRAEAATLQSAAGTVPAPDTPSIPRAARADDGPPPGTPQVFLGMPKIPPKKPKPPPTGADLDRIEKLRRKMREQGMLGDAEDGAPRGALP